MKLYIAEKPSLGRAIAAALAQPIKKHTGYLQAANGDCVSWCFGHLLELAPPDAYGEHYKKWNFQDLPILPQKWQLQEKKNSQQQLRLIKKLSKKASTIVHAGDPDREGQLLVDQVLHRCQLSPQQVKQTQRLLISDLNLAAVKQALQKTQANSHFQTLSTCALARSRADWLVGMNLSRAFTLQSQQQGQSAVLSVGRVQTPLLGLIVKRQHAIDHFVSQAYFEVYAHIAIKQQILKAKWVPSPACKQHCDSQGRVINPALAKNVAQRINGTNADLIDIKQQTQNLSPPLPYNLSSLQIDAANLFRYNAKKVLDICQNLYEQHKVITYPRSDNRYLPEQHFSQAAAILNSINLNLTKNCSKKTVFDLQLLSKANTETKHRCWNDKQVSAHHAIIPTVATTNSLSLEELNIYQLICRQYCGLFFPAQVLSKQQLNFQIQSGQFSYQQTQITQAGWKQLWPNKITNYIQHDFKQGQVFNCTNSEVSNKQTQAPAAFTDATLLKAMTGIARFVDDAEIKATLKDNDGIGTEATRAGIIELLFKRQYVVKDKNNIIPTALGCALINNLPSAISQPDLTALWEQRLKKYKINNLAIDNLCRSASSLFNNVCLQVYSLYSRNIQSLQTKCLIKKICAINESQKNKITLAIIVVNKAI